jgi:hypothetical protein
MTPIGQCRECGKMIEQHETVVYPIKGYEVTRRGGGQNHVVHKQRVDGWAWHELCFDLVMRRAGRGKPAQGTLI